MKKSLIAVAALAATGAFAQTLTIDALIDAGFQSYNYKGNYVTGVGNNGSATSQINIRGNQDFGGGLKGSFRLESQPNIASNTGTAGASSVTSASATGVTTTSTAAASSAFGNGELRLGLSAANIGSLDFGAINNASLTALNAGQPYGVAIGGGYKAFYTTLGSVAPASSVVRVDNSFRFSSASISGFSFTYLGVMKNGTASSPSFTNNGSLGNYYQDGLSELGANYNQGPLNVSLAWQKVDFANAGAITPSTTTVVGTTNNATLITLGANYNIGYGVTAYGLYQTRKTDVISGTPVDTTAYSLTGAYDINASNRVSLSFGSYKNNATSTNNVSNMTSAGYDFFLNPAKSSAVYARYETIRDDAGTATIANNLPVIAGETTRTRAALGYRFVF